MKKWFSIIMLFLIFHYSFASQIKLPEVVFPIEIVSQILEEKKPLPPPSYIEFKPLYENLSVNQYLPIEKPYFVKLPVLTIEKPRAYLGIPPSNALLADSIDYFQRGDFIFAQENLKKFIEKYKDNKNLFYAYYLLGYIDFELKNYQESMKNLEKSCTLNPLKENCLSYAITLIINNEFDKAKEVLDNINQDKDVMFYKSVVQMLKSKQIYVPKLQCDDLDVESVNYCKYFLKHALFLSGKYKDSLDYHYNGEDKKLQKISMILDGFNYYFLKDYIKAKDTFEKFLSKNLSNDNLTNLAYFGLGLIDSGKAENYAQILETRDTYLSYYLYLKVINNYASSNNWLDTFIHIQKVLNLTDRNKENLRFSLAVALYNLKNYEYALNIFSELAKEKNDEETYLYCGLSAYAAKLYKKAQECLSKVVESKDLEKKKTVLTFLAEIYYITDDEENYINTVSMLKELDEDLAYNYLGWYFFKNKDYLNAYKSFKDPYMKAVSIFNYGDIQKAKQLIEGKNDRKSLFLSAYIDIKQGDLEAARYKLKQVAQQSKDELSKKAMYLYAYLYFSEENFQQAIKEFENFRNTFKEDDIYNQKALLRIADSYFNLGEKDLARSMYREFIEKYKGKKEAVDAAYNLVLLETKGENQEKDKVIEDFISKYPDYLLINTLKLQLASIYEEKGEIEKAIKIYQQLSNSQDKDSLLAKYKLAQIYERANQNDKAKEILIELINSQDPDIKFKSNLLLAQIYEKEANLDQAIQIYQNISDNDDVKFKLSTVLVQVGRYNEALNYLKELLDRYPEKSPEISFYIGKIKYLQGLNDEALNYLELSTRSQNYTIASESYFLIGEIYSKKKDLNKALNAYLNAIYTNPNLNDTTAQARLKAADILIKAEKRKEASCLLTPLLDYNNENIKTDVREKLKNLPKCLR
ncbi:tetratricopeptide repeat protein [Sulfurihydrogenibium subterraneum]|uniref:tetratricopeptide repeat protein n=1 Tax=Sulfurihydrogenibium subterraneum TaxID=171121 RepID=UPI00048DB7A9|nr:tetratricopeptide repeat protein [Sulfurihydrogenibium subterraneum]